MNTEYIQHYVRSTMRKQLAQEQEILDLRGKLYFLGFFAVVEFIFILGLLAGRI